MKYRQDPGLDFLKSAEQDDLSILIDYLTKDKDGNSRYTEALTTNEYFKSHYPDHQKYWDLVAAELQCFGANSLATIFRGGEGILYEEILTDVCNKLKVNYNKNSSIETIEMNLLMKILIDAISEMTPEQLKNVVGDLDLKTVDFSKQGVLAAIQGLIRMGGFTSYKMALIVANAVAKQLLGRGLTLATNASLTRAISLFTGPIGWALTALWTIYDIAGPAYRVTIPAVIQISYMRSKTDNSNIT